MIRIDHCLPVYPITDSHRPPVILSGGKRRDEYIYKNGM